MKLNEIFIIFQSSRVNITARTETLAKPGDDGDDVPLLGSEAAQEPLISQSRFTFPIGLPSGKNIFAQFVKNLHIMRRKIGYVVNFTIILIIWCFISPLCLCMMHIPGSEFHSKAVCQLFGVFLSPLFFYCKCMFCTTCFRVGPLYPRDRPPSFSRNYKVIQTLQTSEPNWKHCEMYNIYVVSDQSCDIM